MPDIIPIRNKLWFLNNGVVTPNNVGRRTWESNYEYGFVSAGHFQRCGLKIQKYKDNIIAAYINGEGFVGVGKIANRTVSVVQFLYQYKSLRNMQYINMHKTDTDEFEGQWNLIPLVK